MHISGLADGPSSGDDHGRIADAWPRVAPRRDAGQGHHDVRVRPPVREYASELDHLADEPPLAHRRERILDIVEADAAVDQRTHR